jgi:hypothetical protein
MPFPMQNASADGVRAIKGRPLPKADFIGGFPIRQGITLERVPHWIGLNCNGSHPGI